jgi:mannose-6-phosphate isomerase-like protein (cupin superfamily)
MRVVAARDVAAAEIPGHSFRIVADAGNTGGAFSLTEATSPAGAAVGPHVHDTAIECFYVVEGSYRIAVSGADHEIMPGGFAMVPRGASHQFEVTGGQAGRAVVMFAPAGFESVFRRMPAIFGTPGEPGPLWQRLNEEFSTRLLPETVPPVTRPSSGPPALVSTGVPANGKVRNADGGTTLADAAATRAGLTIALRSDTHPGSAWILPSAITAVWVVAGGYRFEAPSGSADIGAGEYAWLREAAPCRAISLRPCSRALYLVTAKEMTP